MSSVAGLFQAIPYNAAIAMKRATDTKTDLDIFDNTYDAMNDEYYGEEEINEELECPDPL